MPMRPLRGAVKALDSRNYGRRHQGGGGWQMA
jgi:hypothetical protein